MVCCLKYKLFFVRKYLCFDSLHRRELYNLLVFITFAVLCQSGIEELTE